MYDLAIIGGGPAGYTAAELAGKNGLKVVLFEKRALGGVCLNEGCIPTKTLLYSAKVYNSIKNSAKYGICCENIVFDLSKVITRKNKVIRKLVAGIRAKMIESEVEVVIGEARIIDDSVQIICNTQIYTAKKLLICTGSETIIPPISGISKTDFWTHREALNNKEIPKSLLIIGGGAIGIEFASFFSTLGVKVVLVEMQSEILSGMDKELSALLRNELIKKGVEFQLDTKIVSIQNRRVETEKNGERRIFETSQILLSVGRQPILTGWGLENIHLEIFGNGLKVNEFMQTSLPNIYACGDVTGFSLLAHTAICEAEVAIEHILGKNKRMSYKAVPAVVYTCPEMASIGRTEDTLQLENVQYIVKQHPLTYSGRFVAENEQISGICKIIEGKNDTLLGIHILGNPASELIVIAGIAIKKGITANELKAMIFPHPTVGEIIKETL